MSFNTVLIVTGELEENCYLAWLDESREAVVVDPGSDPENIDAELKKRGLSAGTFLQTHCHCDHIGALTGLKALYPQALLYVPHQEAEWLKRPTLNLSYFLGIPITGPDADVLIQPDDRLQAAGITFNCIHVPGHSPGSTAFYAERTGEAPHLFAGDTLMRGSIGRGDLPGGEGEDVLVGNICEKLFVLPDETLVHPGHGLETTIGEEKHSNAFCRVTG